MKERQDEERAQRGFDALVNLGYIAITTPSTVSCGTSTALTATASDPDGDLASVRWFVDGVLMAPTTTSMVFTGTHELRAVARDARGGATTAKKVVSCS